MAAIVPELLSPPRPCCGVGMVTSCIKLGQRWVGDEHGMPADITRRLGAWQGVGRLRMWHVNDAVASRNGTDGRIGGGHEDGAVSAYVARRGRARQSSNWALGLWHDHRRISERCRLPGYGGRWDFDTYHALNTVLSGVNTKAVGSVSEAALLSAFLKKGMTVAVPWGENCGYDLIVDDGRRLLRLQCRTGRYVRGSVIFGVGRVCYSKSAGRVVRHGKSKEVDAYGIYCPELDKCYCISAAKIAASNSVSLRVDPYPKGWTAFKATAWAAEFTI